MSRSDVWMSPASICTDGRRSGSSYSTRRRAGDGERDEGEIVRDSLTARELATAAEAGSADPEDVQVALEELSGVHDYIARDRAAP